MPDSSSAQLVSSPYWSASSSAVNVEPRRRRNSSRTRSTRRLASRVSASRSRCAPWSHWKTAAWSGYATPAKLLGQVLDDERALALLDHPEPAGAQLERLRRAERLQLRLQLGIRGLELAQLGGVLLGGVLLRDPARQRAHVHQKDREQHGQQE